MLVSDVRSNDIRLDTATQGPGYISHSGHARASRSGSIQYGIVAANETGYGKTGIYWPDAIGPIGLTIQSTTARRRTRTHSPEDTTKHPHSPSPPSLLLLVAPGFHMQGVFFEHQHTELCIHRLVPGNNPNRLELRPLSTLSPLSFLQRR